MESDTSLSKITTEKYLNRGTEARNFLNFKFLKIRMLVGMDKTPVTHSTGPNVSPVSEVEVLQHIFIGSQQPEIPEMYV